MSTELSDTGLRTLVEHNVDGMLVLDPAGTILFANPAAGRLLGWDTTPPAGTASGLPIAGAANGEIEIVDATDRIVALRTAEISWQDGPAILATLRDVTARHRSEAALRETNRTLEAVISAAPVAIARVDPDGRVLAWNRAAELIFGWTEAELLGSRSPIPVVPPPADEDVEVRRRDGTTVSVALSVADVTGASGELEAIVLVASDTTDRRLREAEVQHLAAHDPLTGLLNRRSLEQALDRAVARIDRGRDTAEGGVTGALLLIDLDRFKAVNDTAGHLAGDQMLVGAARAIAQAVRPGEIVARFGGDEFAVLLARADGEGARAAANRIRGCIAEFALTIGGERHTTTATIGGAIIDGSLDAAEVLAVADVALHAAKDTARDSVLIHEEAAGKALELAQVARRARAVRRALDAGRFVVEHQPLVALSTGEEAACEALIRLPDDGSLELPDDFLPLADSMGLMWEIDRWMTGLAVRALEDPAHPPVWVNLWRSSLGHPAILDVVRDAPEALIAGRLGFELPEAARQADLERSAGWVAELRELGCRFALDDFGAETTTFALLRELPVDLVKIDRQYALRLAEDPIDRQMVRAIVDVCHSLGMAVAVEGVEDEAIRDAATGLGVDLGQGFLWSPRTAAG